MKVEVDPQERLAQSIKKASAEVSNLTIPLRLIAQSWFKSNEAIFQLKGPGKYEPFQGKKDASGLTAYQRKKREERGFDYPLLLAEGAIKRSITNPQDSQSVNSIVNKIALLLGTQVPHAIFHQSKLPRNKLPRRPVVLFGNEQVAPGALSRRIEIWEKIIYDYVAQVSGAKPNGA